MTMQMTNTHKELTVLKQILEKESLISMQWFADNFMKANSGKFQAICVGQKAYDAIKSFQLQDTTIKCEEKVTLLKVNIDYLLIFNDHIYEICKKASK